MMEDLLARRLRSLETRVMVLSVFCAVLAAGLVITIWTGAVQKVRAAQTTDVLRVRGLVIQDAQGRARILLGAPFPSVPDRLRQDSTATSLLFLDEQGHDRISIGQVTPAQINGKVPANFHRIGNAYGLTIYDADGNERGGMGFLTNGKKLNRAAIVLDRPGADAIGMDVDDNSDSANLALMYSPKVGADATGLILSTRGDEASITMKDSHDKPRASFTVGPKLLPSFRIFDQNGKAGPDLLPSTGVHAN